MNIPKLEGVVVITGASGFIGRRLREVLLADGVDVLSFRRAGSPPSKTGRSVEVDYADLEGLKKVIAAERPNYVLHLAGATKGVTYEDFRRANVMPTQNLVEALKAVHPGVSRFVHVSSLSSYGPSGVDAHHHEEMERKPVEFYGRSKLEAEQVVEAAKDALPWTILRPGGVYGPGDVDYFELFKSVERGLNVFFGNKDRYFSAVYVDDLVSAIIHSAASPSSRGKGYFICDGQPLSWGEFQSHIVQASGKKVRTLNLPEVLVSVAAWGGELMTRIDGKPRLFNRQKALMGAQPAWTCQHTAAKRDFGYRPEVPVPEGVRKTLEWYRTQGWV